MTDPKTRQTATDRGPGKHERLVTAAVRLVHQQGVEQTTLADIAKAADVPVGGVYYYFKTKDDVVAAVINAHGQLIRTTLSEIESRHRSPKSRIKALVQAFADQHENVARFGCPLGSLCSELDKRPGEPSPAAELMRLPIEWAERQFQALGRQDAHDLAVDLLAAYEGSALLANTMHDPDLLTRAARRIDKWIDAL
jgi:AcrR family transcriptional regulator